MGTNTKMQVRAIGATGKKAGIIGLGCEQLDGKPYAEVKQTLDAALDAGVNLIDAFMPGAEVRQNIAKALGQRRGEVMVQGHIGSTDIGQQYDISRDLPTVKRYFEDMLRIFGGHIDFGMLFFIDSDEDFQKVFEGGIADYAQGLRQKGDIGHIGFSSHNPVTARRAVETGLPEVMMFSINPAFDAQPAADNALETLEKGFDKDRMVGIDPKRSELYSLCAQKGVGITVMKTLGAGKLISAEHSPFSPPLTVAQCVHYALSRPAVASVLLGARSPQEVQRAMAYFDATDEEKDYTPALRSMKSDFAGHCVYCNHCQPCPAKIDIASVHRYLDIALLDPANIPPSVVAHYKALHRYGSDCLPCGGCETRCPFGVPVIQNMGKAVSIFGH